MRLYVAVTDNDWFALHTSKNQVDEVNFWRPSAGNSFKVLRPGELLLFKLHAPENFLVGGGFFTRFLDLPLRLAWDAFRRSGSRIPFSSRDEKTHYCVSSLLNRPL